MENKTINIETFLQSTDRRVNFKRETVYTNDENTVELYFDIKDTDITGMDAQVLLYMNDGSFFQRKVSDGVIVGSDFVSYTLKENEGKHAGDAEAQLRVINGTKKLASHKHGYHIAPGLDNIVAVEHMITDWTTLTKEASKFLADSKTEYQNQIAILRDKIDNAIVEPEVAAKYEALEAEYATKLTGVTAQLAQKVNKEDIKNIGDASPKGVFDTFEGLKSSYPNGASGVYIVNSDGKWYYWTGVEWVGGGVYQSTLSADFPATNKVVNGDFKNGTTNWGVTSGATFNGITGDTASVIGTGSSTSVGITQSLSAIPLGDKVYGRVMVKLVGFSSLVKFNVSTADFSNQVIEADTWTELSNIISKPSNSMLVVQAIFNDAPSALNKEIQIKYVMAVDLTETFGSLNVPTASEFDSILELYPNKHFNGTVSPLVSNREVFRKSRSLESVLTNVKLKQDLTSNNVILFDDFNRANGDLGDEIFGEAWNTNMPSSNVWSIVNGKAKCSISASVRQAFINAKVSDFDLSCDVDFHRNAGLSFRQSRVYGEGASMFLFRINTTSATLFKYSNSDYSTTIGTFEGVFSPGLKYNLRVIVIGSLIKCYVDGVLVIEVTDGYNSKETHCGIVSTTSTDELFDDFKIKKLDNPKNSQDFSKPEPIENVFTLDLSKSSNFEITNETIDTKEIDFKNVSAEVNNLLVVSVKLNNLATSNFIFPSGTLWQDNDAPSFQYSTYMLLFISYDGGSSWLASYVGGW